MRNAPCTECITDEEGAILEGLARGEGYGTIGHDVFMAPATVSYLVAKMQHRLPVHNRAALVALAMVTGVLRVGHWPPALSRKRHLSLEPDCPDSSPVG